MLRGRAGRGLNIRYVRRGTVRQQGQRLGNMRALRWLCGEQGKEPQHVVDQGSKDSSRRYASVRRAYLHEC